MTFFTLLVLALCVAANVPGTIDGNWLNYLSAAFCAGLFVDIFVREARE